MAKNWIFDIAEDLKVNIGEVFRIKGEGLVKYVFTEDGLMFYDKPRGEWYYADNTLKDLVLGKLEIFKSITLSQKEKDYLKAVIEPYKDKVVYLYKDKYPDCLVIGVSENYDEKIVLPATAPGLEFNELELLEDYTLEDILCD